MGDYPPVAEVIPHRRRMLWIERILDWTPSGIVCGLDIDAGSPFVRDRDGASAIIAIELMAQSVAAHVGMKSRRGGGGPHVGYIIAIQSLELDIDRFEVGQSVWIEARRTAGDELLGKFSCAVGLERRVVARGFLSVVQDAGGTGRMSLWGET